MGLSTLLVLKGLEMSREKAGDSIVTVRKLICGIVRTGRIASANRLE